MPPAPTSNNGSTFYNQNECRSFNQTVTTALTRLSSQPCSEVILINRTTSTLSAYDGGYTGEPFAMLLKADESMTFRGLTNSDQLSAKAAVQGPVFYRTQYFSNNPSR